jgi:DnaJ-class molecular chaperone
MHDEIRSEERKVEEAVKGKGINPERYGMVFCSNCGGSGKYFYGNNGVSVCRVCGGFGLVRMERNPYM